MMMIKCAFRISHMYHRYGPLQMSCALCSLNLYVKVLTTNKVALYWRGPVTLPRSIPYTGIRPLYSFLKFLRFQFAVLFPNIAKKRQMSYSAIFCWSSVSWALILTLVLLCYPHNWLGLWSCGGILLLPKLLILRIEKIEVYATWVTTSCRQFHNVYSNIWQQRYCEMYNIWIIIMLLPTRNSYPRKRLVIWCW